MSEANATATTTNEPRTKNQPAKKGGKPNQPAKPKMTREEWKQNKIDKAGDDNFNVISARTYDVSDYIGLLNQHDYLIDQLRKTFDRRGITGAKLDELMGQSHTAKLSLNSLNQEIAILLGKQYTAPRFIRDLEKVHAATAAAAVPAVAESDVYGDPITAVAAKIGTK